MVNKKILFVILLSILVMPLTFSSLEYSNNNLPKLEAEPETITPSNDSWNETLADNTYLKLDGSNNPTATIDFLDEILSFQSGVLNISSDGTNAQFYTPTRMNFRTPLWAIRETDNGNDALLFSAGVTSGSFFLKSNGATTIEFQGATGKGIIDGGVDIDGDSKKLTQGASGSTDYYQEFDGTNQQYYTSGDFQFIGDSFKITSPIGKIPILDLYSDTDSVRFVLDTKATTNNKFVYYTFRDKGVSKYSMIYPQATGDFYLYDYTNSRYVFYYDESANEFGLLSDNQKFSQGASGATDYYQMFDGTDQQYYTSGKFNFKGGLYGDLLINPSQNNAGDIVRGTSIQAQGTYDDLNIITNPNGASGSSVNFVAYNGNSWRGMIKYQSVSSGEPDLVLVKSGGNVGIGTSSPDEKLEVEGNIHLDDNHKSLYGTGKDASIYYDGSDFIFDSQEVGTGDFVFNNGDVNITKDLYVQGNITQSNGFSGSCINVTYQGGIAISCND